jgi:hypothetical protein
MNPSAIEVRSVLAQKVEVTEDALTVHLSDGRTISAPVMWYPRLEHGTLEERNKYEFNGGGLGIHWPDSVNVAQRDIDPLFAWNINT